MKKLNLKSLSSKQRNMLIVTHRAEKAAAVKAKKYAGKRKAWLESLPKTRTK